MEVHLKFIRANNWSGFSKYPNCHEYLGSIWTRSGNRYTGLTEEDARRLETAIGYPEGHLSPHSSFWISFAIAVGKDGVTLHTERPEDELRYLFCKGHKRVALNKAAVRPCHDFVMINSEVDAVENNKHNKLRMKAFEHFKKMSVEEIRKCLRLYGKSALGTTSDVSEEKMFEMIDENPSKFLEIWVNNKSRETRYIIEEAVAKNILRRQKHLYYYGTDVIGRSLDDTIVTLDDKANQDLRMTILSELEAKIGAPNPDAA